MTTKIHAVADALGNPLAVSLTGGQVHDVQAHDISEADELVKQVEPKARVIW